MDKQPTCFKYPVNLNMLELASLVSMYRTRGMPEKAPPGSLYLCPITHKLVKETKNWFGLHYSQAGWDQLITPNANGYPLTTVEFNLIGLIRTYPRGYTNRSFLERSCGVLPQLAYIIINDIKGFGFIEELERDHFEITVEGERALQGFAKRVYEKKFAPELLLIHRSVFIEPKIAKAQKANDDQYNLFQD